MAVISAPKPILAAFRNQYSLALPTSTGYRRPFHAESHRLLRVRRNAGSRWQSHSPSQGPRFLKQAARSGKDPSGREPLRSGCRPHQPRSPDLLRRPAPQNVVRLPFPRVTLASMVCPAARCRLIAVCTASLPAALPLRISRTFLPLGFVFIEFVSASQRTQVAAVTAPRKETPRRSSPRPVRPKADEAATGCAFRGLPRWLADKLAHLRAGLPREERPPSGWLVVLRSCQVGLQSSWRQGHRHQHASRVRYPDGITLVRKLPPPSPRILSSFPAFLIPTLRSPRFLVPLRTFEHPR